MEYVRKNITGTEEVRVIRGRDLDRSATKINVINKCLIVNTYTGDVTVDAYIKAIDYAATERKYGHTEGDKVEEVFYIIKQAVIPTGVSLELFDEHPCTADNRYSFFIKLSGAAETADVLINYDSTNISGSRTGRNQY
jgi:hypothetical protein